MELNMRQLFLIVLSLLILSFSSPQKNYGETAKQQQIYKSWVLSRCLSKVQTDDAMKQDALNSASAYLEESGLPVESFTRAEPLIDSYVAKNYQGSISGTFNVKKCVDLIYSADLEQFIIEEINPIL